MINQDFLLVCSESYPRSFTFYAQTLSARITRPFSAPFKRFNKIFPARKTVCCTIFHKWAIFWLQFQKAKHFISTQPRLPVDRLQWNFIDAKHGQLAVSCMFPYGGLEYIQHLSFVAWSSSLVPAPSWSNIGQLETIVR